jgi:hypothetical protein
MEGIEPSGRQLNGPQPRYLTAAERLWMRPKFAVCLNDELFRIWISVMGGNHRWLARL